MARPNVISREDLLEAAKKVLVERGMPHFTLKAVAEMGGVTQGTVYYHFRTKEQLLLEIVKDTCEQSWSELLPHNENLMRDALASAKSRCSHDSFFHKLFLTLLVSSFSNEQIREQLSGIMQEENEALSKSLKSVWPQSPMEGVSHETWGIFFNALVDGLAIQALLSKDFPVEKTYDELKNMLIGLNRFGEQEGGK